MGHQSFSEKSQTRQVIQLIFDHLAAGSGVTLTQVNGVMTIAATGGGVGTVTSAGISTGTSGVSVTGSPITTSGTIDLALGTLAAVNDAPSDGTTYGRLNGAWAAAGGSGVTSVVADPGIVVDSTIPAAPKVGVKLSSDVGNIAVFGTDDGVFVTAGPALMVGGSAQDGDCDLDGVNTFPWATLSGSTYHLQGSGRTPFINRLRISTGITLDPSQRALFVKQWDVTTGFYGTINTDGTSGTNATNAGVGGGGANTSAGGTYFPATVGVVGTGGSFGVSSGNSDATAQTTTNRTLSGGRGGRGGDGGAGSVGTPGTVPNLASSSYLFGMGVSPYSPIGDYGTENSNGDGGQSSSGGSGGTGDGTNLGGNGGGGGHGARGVDLIVGEILTDATTPAGMISSRGGNGGNGFTKAAGNVGGGGGGGSGGGGAIRCVMGRLVGPPVTGFFDASGGTGGNGGNGVGTGANGNGGNGATGGVICFYNLAAGTVTSVVRPAGSAAVGTVGGAGGVCAVDLS